MNKQCWKKATARVIGVAVLWSTSLLYGQNTLLYGISPGKAHAAANNDILLLSNDLLTARWAMKNRQLSGLDISAPGIAEKILLPHDPFVLTFKDGSTVHASDMQMVGGTRLLVLSQSSVASRGAEHFSGYALELQLRDAVRGVSILWRAVLRDESNYIRQEITISADQRALPIAEVSLFNGNLPNARIAGRVKGSPVVAGDFFVGFENPLASCQADEPFNCGLKRELPLRRGQSVTYSLVIGFSPPGQMRRGFLNYLERERAHPYRTFLHYNTWYDIGFGKPYTAADVLDVIHAFGTELVRKRGVKMDSFLLDDGWDNPHSVWHMNAEFPGGLVPLNREAQKYGAAMGVWFSPWGGYEQAKEERLSFGREHGFETNAGGFALSGPKYFQRFRQASLGFVHDGIDQFKIDGTGNVNSVYPGSSFDSDFAAAIRLIEDWRAVKPDIYVNLTTGTYPSPFWLLYADSIWRAGEDHSFAGVGSWREKWITYRDEQTYRNVVEGGPLFPLSSLMLHGLIYAKQAEHLQTDPGNDFANEVHSYFGSGTQLQEMYISHELLSERNWDTLAEAANWSRRNAEILRDTHWVGGDPGKLEVYGWASWSPVKGILTLRNPSDRQQSISLDISKAFELTHRASTRYLARSPWERDQGKPAIILSAGQEHTFTLAPFEVLNLEAVPQTP